MQDMNSTIVAISTPVGAAARAIVRASGPRALDLAESVFTSIGKPLAELGGFRTVAGWIGFGGLSLPGRAYVFVAPLSYTRQDVVELHTPGHPLAAAMLADAMIAAGGRAAEPGEFTQRAFLSGRIDLSAAEAVADIIAAATDAQLRAAEANAAGALASLCLRWTDAATEALAEVEASIDMAEEDLDLIAPGVLAGQLAALAADMAEAAATAGRPPATVDIPRIAITGAPNVGKSSLLNALTGLDRAIVSATAGATRDVLTAPLTLDGDREILLMDLAGWADTDDLPAAAANDAAGNALAAADGVVAVVDITAPDTTHLDRIVAMGRGQPTLILANKTDLLDPESAQRQTTALADRTGLPVVATSATTGAGTEEVIGRLGDMLAVGATRTASGVAMHDRQRQAVERAGDILLAASRRAGQIAQVSNEAEFLAIELRDGLTELGTVSGDAITEEVLHQIFARFCIGK